MVYVFAWLIFVALATACWYVSLACLLGTAGEADAAAVPNRPMPALVAVLAVSLTSFLPFPLGWADRLLVWGVASFAGLDYPPAGHPCCSPILRRARADLGFS